MSINIICPNPISICVIFNEGYLQWSRKHRLTRFAEPITIHLYSEVLQKFRLAAQGKRPGKQPPDHLRKRVETYFDPLPMYYVTLGITAD